MLGLVSAGIGALGGIAGGIGSAIQNRKLRKELNNQSRANDNWFNKEYYQDFTERADTQQLLTNMRNQMNDRYKIADNSAIVTGASPEAASLQKQGANEAYGDAIGNINAQGVRFKHGIMDRYMDVKQNIDNQKAGIRGNRAQQWANAGGNMASAGMDGLASADWDAVKNFFTKKK